MKSETETKNDKYNSGDDNNAERKNKYEIRVTRAVVAVYAGTRRTPTSSDFYQCILTSVRLS